MAALTSTLKKRICSLAKDGLSCREITQELRKRGETVGKTAVAQVIAEGLKQRRGPVADKTGTTSPPDPDHPSESTADDLALLDRLIAETREDAKKLRKRGDHRGCAVATRLVGELVKQRAELRPPPKPDPDEDPENIRIRDELLDDLERQADAFEKERDLEWDAMVAEAVANGCPLAVGQRIRKRLAWYFNGEGVLETFPPPEPQSFEVEPLSSSLKAAIQKAEAKKRAGANPPPEPERPGTVAPPDPDEPSGSAPPEPDDDPTRSRSMLVETRLPGQKGPTTLNKPMGWRREDDDGTQVSCGAFYVDRGIEGLLPVR